MCMGIVSAARRSLSASIARIGSGKRTGLFFLPLIICTLSIAQARPPEAYVEGEVIITFKPAISRTAAQQMLKSHSLALDERFAGLSQWRGKETGLIRAGDRTTAALIAELRQNTEVETVEPNYLRWVSVAPPDDTFFSNLWALQNTGQSVQGTSGTAGSDIRFVPAWAMAQSAGTNPPVVAIIDSGVDYSHPDLTANMWMNSGEIPGNGLDDDGNGYVDDRRGYNFADNRADPADSGYHGTHVGGTIAATGNNGQGVIGVNSMARIMPLRASSDGTTLPDSAIIAAVQYATLMKTRGVNVVAINASFGGGGSNSTERAAIVAAGNAGIIFCAAAGNETNNNDTAPTYPASYRLTNMIVVAATDQNDALATFSNYGTNSVGLAAPGYNVYSCLPVAGATMQTSVQQETTTYAASEIAFSGYTTGITATVQACGLGYPADFPAAVSNNIALIQRGTLLFSQKTSNAMTAGARAVIIYNNTNGDFSTFTLGTNFINWVPTAAISQADGLAMQTNALTTIANTPNPAQIYGYLNGTSMATPHVAGAVAFAAMNFPNETVPQRIQRILTNATVVNGLNSKVTNGRRLNLQRMVDADTNGLPDWWELEYYQHLTGTSPNVDTDGDGLSSLGEWLAGTNPTNAASGLRLTVQSAGTPAGTELRWPSVAGKTYRLVRATNLLAGFNSIVRTNIAATAPTNTETDPLVLPGDARYYRIGVEQ